MRFTPAVGAMSLTAVATLGLGLWVGTAGAVSHRPAVSRGLSSYGPPVSHPSKGAAAGSRMYAGDCAGTCFGLYSRQLGISVTMNAQIAGDTGTGGIAGRKINVHLARNNRPNGNFTPSAIGRVWQFCGTDPNDFFAPTSYACQNYSNFWVFEAQWSPRGNESGLCVGVAAAGLNGESVTLQPCGRSARTLWIGDRANGRGGDCRYPGNYCPWLSGGGANSSPPLALTVEQGTGGPANRLKVERLVLTGSTASNNQQFAYFWGPVA